MNTLVTTKPAQVWNGLASLSIFWIIGIVVCATFFASEHELWRIGIQQGGVSEEAIAERHEDNTSGASLNRQVGFMTIGLMGLFFIAKPIGKRVHPHPGLFLLILSLFGWCVLSTTWASLPILAFKRLVLLSCCLLGFIGIGRQLSLRQYVYMTLWIALAQIAYSGGIELITGNFRPWISEYRFGGTVHPNMMASYAAVVCLAAACLAQRSQKRVFYLVLFAVGILVLILTKSRSSLGAVTIALGISWFMTRTQFVKNFGLSIFISSISGVLFLYGMFGSAFGETISGTLLMGRAEKAGSLTGRVPLWNELWENYLSTHFWRGYGYDCFWIPNTIHEVSKSQEWAITTAHNAYLEFALSVGMIGLLMLLIIVFWAMMIAITRYSQTKNPAYSFVLSMIIYGLLHGMLEAHAAKPMFVSFMAGCGILALIFYYPENEDPVTHELLDYSENRNSRFGLTGITSKRSAYDHG